MSNGHLSGRTPGEPHQARQMAESFGDDAERYQRTRPHYPSAMVEAILAASPGTRVLDVGIGTGLSARPFEEAGRQVLGVEPDERMAAWARRSGLDVEVARFEEWDRAGRTFDLVIAGQAWHWLDPDVAGAKAAECLRPGGRLALFWNVMSYPPDFAESFSAVYRRVLPDFPFFQQAFTGGTASYAQLAERSVDGLERSGGFVQPERWEFDWHRTYQRDEWLEMVPTFGGHSGIAPDRLSELLAGIGGAVDEAGGAVTIAYTALVVTAKRTAPGAPG